MRYIPWYYAIPWSEHIECSKPPHNEPLRCTKEEAIQARLDCNAYEKAVIEAVKAAHEKYIAKWSNRSMVYSKTWGK